MKLRSGDIEEGDTVEFACGGNAIVKTVDNQKDGISMTYYGYNINDRNFVYYHQSFGPKPPHTRLLKVTRIIKKTECTPFCKPKHSLLNLVSEAIKHWRSQ